MSDTVGAILRAGSEALAKADIPNAIWEARHLLADLTGLTPTQMLTDAERAVPEADTYRTWIALRAAGEPASRITGFREFYGHRFKVGPATLDPRMDSEVLVDVVLEEVPSEAAGQLADLGTGTGCLLLSILLERPEFKGTGVDLSEDAVQVASENAQKLGVEDRAEFLCSSWSEGLGESSLDVLISNPPYIQSGVIADLDADVRDHDPILALDGGQDGLDAYRAILSDANRVLKPGGLIVFEIGYDQGRSVPALLEQRRFRDIRIVPDSAGLDRVVRARVPF